MIHLPSKIFAVMCLLHFITLETPFSVAYLNGFKPKMYCRSYVTMNTDQVPLSQSRSIMPSIAKKSLFGFGSLLSIALLKRERAIAIDLPECSDSVTIFRRSADNREVRIYHKNCTLPVVPMSFLSLHCRYLTLTPLLRLS